MAPTQIKNLLLFGAAAAALLAVRLGPAWFRAAERWLAALARRQVLTVILVGLFAPVMRVALLPLIPVPQPEIHDEFSYLLAADTFAHGRLVNPAHRLWTRFESFHIVVSPFYASKFYPAQGLVLAAGQVLTGYAWVGVLLSTAAMCAGICWMLQGWLPPGWALLGGVLAAVEFGLVDYWINSYWGGALPALGGALVLGAWPRIRRRRCVRDALWMGLGFAVLASSRPFEGLIFGLPVACIMLIWMFGKRAPRARVLFRRTILPLALVLVVAGGALGFYFWRVTGNPFLLPYQVYEEQYNPVPPLFFQSPRPTPAYRHAVFREFHIGWVMPFYELKRSSFAGFLRAEANQESISPWFYANPATVVGVLLLPWSFRDRRVRLLLTTCIVSLAGSALISFPAQPHYLAPITGSILGIALQGMRHLRACGRRGHRTGTALVRVIVVFCALLTAINVAAVPLDLPGSDSYHFRTLRAHVAAELEKYPGPQLAIVKYLPGHNVHDEWVYNAADIDHAKIVWARDMGTEKNEELIRYYPDRRVWLVEPDMPPHWFKPYPVSPAH